MFVSGSLLPSLGIDRWSTLLEKLFRKLFEAAPWALEMVGLCLPQAVPSEPPHYCN